HQHAVGEEDRLGRAMGDEEDRRPRRLPDAQELLVHELARDLVERAERPRPRRGDPPISSGSSTFWSALRQGRRVESWNTKPKTRRRRATPGGSPPPSIRPSGGARVSATSRSSVDFPQPDGPRRETNSRGWIARLAPASAWRGPEGVENVIPTSSTRIPAGAVAPALLAPGAVVGTLEDVLGHLVLRGDGRLQESEVSVDLDGVIPDLRLHPAPALLLGPVRPEERRLPLPRRA